MVNFWEEVIRTLSEDFEKLILEDEFTTHFFSFPLPEFNGTLLTNLELKHKFIHFPSLTIYDINNDKFIQALKGTSVGFKECLFSIDSILYFNRPNSKNYGFHNHKIFFL